MKQFSILLLTLALAACSKERTKTYSYQDIEGAPGMMITVGAVTLEFDETIKYHYERTTDSLGGDSSETTINGMKFALIGDTLHFDEHEFSRIQSGDLVELGDAGIQVNGEVRWPMPTR